MKAAEIQAALDKAGLKSAVAGIIHDEVSMLLAPGETLEQVTKALAPTVEQIKLAELSMGLPVSNMSKPETGSKAFNVNCIITGSTDLVVRADNEEEAKRKALSKIDQLYRFPVNVEIETEIEELG